MIKKFLKKLFKRNKKEKNYEKIHTFPDWRDDPKSLYHRRYF